jgi:hypothetical protein
VHLIEFLSEMTTAGDSEGALAEQGQFSLSQTSYQFETGLGAQRQSGDFRRKKRVHFFSFFLL